MRIHFKYPAMGLLAAVLSVSPAMAKGGGNGKGANKQHQHDGGNKGKKDANKPPGQAGKNGRGADKDKDDTDGLWLPVVDSDAVRRLALQNDFGGQKPLPPGIRKNLLRGKPLPPGIARTRLPDPYVASLPMRPGYEWRAYGTDLVLVSLASNVVARVISDALR